MLLCGAAACTHNTPREQPWWVGERRIRIGAHDGAAVEEAAEGRIARLRGLSVVDRARRPEPLANRAETRPDRLLDVARVNSLAPTMAMLKVSETATAR